MACRISSSHNGYYEDSCIWDILVGSSDVLGKMSPPYLGLKSKTGKRPASSIANKQSRLIFNELHGVSFEKTELFMYCTFIEVLRANLTTTIHFECNLTEALSLLRVTSFSSIQFMEPLAETNSRVAHMLFVLWQILILMTIFPISLA
jgi:hypothetical protein